MLSRRNKLSSYLAVAAFSVTLPASSVEAAVSWDNISTKLSPSFVTKDLVSIIVTIVNLFLFVAAVVAFVYAIWGGFQYLTAGSDDAKSGSGRKTIVNAVIGLFIIAMAYAIISFSTGFVNNLNKPSVSANGIDSGTAARTLFSNDLPAQVGNPGATNPNTGRSGTDKDITGFGTKDNSSTGATDPTGYNP